MEKYKNFGLLVLTLLFALPAAAWEGWSGRMWIRLQDSVR